jgi:hypothetical protein
MLQEAGYNNAFIDDLCSQLACFHEPEEEEEERKLVAFLSF